jgi:hypothetical protein
LPRLVLATLAGAFLGLWIVGYADRTGVEAHVAADGVWDLGIFQGFSAWEPGAGRVAGPESELVLAGLWEQAPVAVAVTLASALPTAQVVSVYANGLSAVSRDVGGRLGVLRFGAQADALGRLRLRFVGDGRPLSAVRVARLELVRIGSGGIPAGRWLLYAAFVLAAAVVCRCGMAGTAVSFGVPLLCGLALAWALRSERLVVVAWLPWLLTGLSLGLLAFGVSRVLRLSSSAAGWIAVSLTLRALLVLHPAFQSVDLSFHAHNVWRFAAGQAITSRVSSPAGDGMLTIPYPPLLYAVLSPLVSSEAQAETALRVAMLLFEGLTPWLVLGLLRAAGGSAGAAASAAVAAAVMPEGLLVLAKGIAANILGSCLSLATIWAVVQGTSPAVLGLLAAATFLAHPGAAATLVGLLGLFMSAESVSGRLPARRAAAVGGALALAALLAWFAYYREVAAGTLRSLGSLSVHMQQAPGSFFALRGIHVLKIVQNLGLKFGGAPVWLAVVGLRSEAGGRVQSLLRCWLFGGAMLAALAVFTPFAVRFEYFLVPAVAMAAGQGAELWRQAGRAAWLNLAWASSLALQAWIGYELLLGRFEIISVVIPSPRWVWPLQPW